MLRNRSKIDHRDLFPCLGSRASLSLSTTGAFRESLSPFRDHDRVSLGLSLSAERGILLGERRRSRSRASRCRRNNDLSLGSEREAVVYSTYRWSSGEVD